MSNTLKILLTGGGTAGHVTPQVALIEHIQAICADIKLCYVGSNHGIEKKLIQRLNITYHGIRAGKLRRHLSWRNLIMPFQLIIGILQSIKICWLFKPNVVFSKGGFVALPVVIAAWILHIPVIVHESDVIPGLANRLSFPLANLICYTFDIPFKTRHQQKLVLTGLPIRALLVKGNAQQAIDRLGLHYKKPVLLVWGGSLGSVTLNQSIHRLLPRLTRQFQVIHLCGPLKLLASDKIQEDYHCFEYLDATILSHVIAAAELVVSRAGATAICELLLLHKPHVLCPLSTQASRGEQIANANYVEKLGLSHVIEPQQFSDTQLFRTIQHCYKGRLKQKKKIAQFNLTEGTHKVYEQLLKFK